MKSRAWLSVLLGVVVLSASAAAADKKAELEAKAQKTNSAATIDFQATLGVDFASLESLGLRIEQARKSSDPVGLAAAAVELAAAEKASGKSAKIKADELKKDAIALAKLRDSAEELTAVQSLTGADLSTQAADAAKRQAKELATAKEGAAPKGIFRELVVDNESEVTVAVSVNGRLKGYVGPYGHAHFRVHTHHETVLDAQGQGHTWHTHVDGDYDSYEWRLLDSE